MKEESNINSLPSRFIAVFAILDLFHLIYFLTQLSTVTKVTSYMQKRVLVSFEKEVEQKKKSFSFDKVSNQNCVGFPTLQYIKASSEVLALLHLVSKLLCSFSCDQRLVVKSNLRFLSFA
jgi:hypothetical protein